jgi:hypothetical protein
MLVDTDFPGGNAVIEDVSDDLVVIRPDLRDTIGDWFYWCIRVRDCAAETVRVRVHGEPSFSIGVRGPAVSRDAGRTWSWLGSDAVHDGEFTVSAPRDGAELLISFGMPYTTESLERFLASPLCEGRVERRELTRSEQGRPVEVLRLGCITDPEFRVLFTCRHHCCEMMASYVLEGVLQRVLTPDQAEGAWLSENVEVVAVPFVDIDGVEAGDQGKNRSPHDHGRDYGPDEGIYAAVRAIKDLLTGPYSRPFDAVVDLHCPNIAGTTNQRSYFVGTSDQDNWALVQELAGHLERVAEALPYQRSNDLPFGTAWNVAGNYASRDGRSVPQQSIAKYLDDVPSTGVHSILEFPYADAEGAEVNAASARGFGGDLAQALALYLRSRIQS